MFTVTAAAEEHLAGVLREANAPDDVAVRLVSERGQLQLRADSAQPEDTTFEHDGRTVLLVDQQVNELLDGHTLGVEEGDDGRRLSLTHEPGEAPQQAQG